MPTRGVAADQKLYNRSPYTLWIAYGSIKDGSIAGIGGNGYTDPDPRVRAHGWTKLPSGSSLNVKGRIFVAAVNNGRMMPVPVEDGRPQYRKIMKPDRYWYPVSRKKFKADLPLRGREADQVRRIRNAGYEPHRFYNVGYTSIPTWFVGADSGVRKRLDDFFRATSTYGGTYIHVKNNWV